MITTEITQEFIKALDGEHYFDAHEVLEKIWYENRHKDSNEVKLIKGFINAATSFELYKLGRISASNKVWKNYLKYRQLIFKTGSDKVALYYEISLHVDNVKKKIS